MPLMSDMFYLCLFDVTFIREVQYLFKVQVWAVHTSYYSVTEYIIYNICLSICLSKRPVILLEFLQFNETIKGSVSKII